jgi:hypothetical protein
VRNSHPPRYIPLRLEGTRASLGGGKILPTGIISAFLGMFLNVSFLLQDLIGLLFVQSQPWKRRHTFFGHLECRDQGRSREQGRAIHVHTK